MGVYRGTVPNPWPFTSGSFTTQIFCLTNQDARKWLGLAGIGSIVVGGLIGALLAGLCPSLIEIFLRILKWLGGSTAELPGWLTVWIKWRGLATLFGGALGAGGLLWLVMRAINSGNCACPAGQVGFCVCVTLVNSPIVSVAGIRIPVWIAGCPASCATIVPPGCP